MAVPNRQIGWSQESNLLWEITRQMDRLTKVVSTSGGGGGTNPTSTFLPVNSGGIFIDSYLKQDGNILKTNFNGTNTGLYLDGGASQYAIISDFNFGQSSGLNMDIAVGNYSLGSSGYNADPFGLVIQSGSQIMLGDSNGIWSYQRLVMENGRIYTGTSSVAYDGIHLDYSQDSFILGSGETGNHNGIEILNSNTSNPVINIGNFKSGGNGTQFVLDDLKEQFTFQNTTTKTFFQIDVHNSQLSTNKFIVAAPMAIITAQFIPIICDGNQYYLPLYQ